MSFWLISNSFSGDRHFENLAMGNQTSPYQAVDCNKNLIHVQRINEAELNSLNNALNHYLKDPLIFFFGNSQTHGINQIKDSDVNYVELLYRKYKDQSIGVLCNSLPNASLQEFYLLYNYWKTKTQLKILVLPVFMDDMREDGLRDVFYPELIHSHFQISDSSDYLTKKINHEIRSFWSQTVSAEKTVKKDNNADMAALRETVQESTETYLNDKLERNSIVWANRPNVRGEFFNWLYKFRNTVLGIKASTVRKMIPQRYEYNLHALDLIVDDCMKKGIKVLLYIPPIRSDVTLPYDSADYIKFKKEIAEYHNKFPGRVFFRNFEKIVTGYLWGYKEATNLTDDREIDYMHFQYKGHQIMADSLQNVLNIMLH